MTAETNPIPGPWRGRLLIVPRPRGGDWLADDVAAWRRDGVDIVVSLLTPEEAGELGIADEEAACRANEVGLVSFPIPDRGVPESREAALDLLHRLDAALSDGKTVAVHCRQGIGRSAMIAAGLLVLAGFEPAAAIQHVQAARGLPVPETPEQREWIGRLARSLRRPLTTESSSSN
jgi:protein-tyrosine phosphatase